MTSPTSSTSSTSSGCAPIYPQTDRCGFTKDFEDWLKQQGTGIDYMMESSKHDGEIDPCRCCARMWNGGFGGQCGKEAVDFDEGLTTNIYGERFDLGLCKHHAGMLARKGKLTHGFFTEVPERHHAWRWRHSADDWKQIEEDKAKLN
jgi:hypothetical protein